MQWTTNGPPIGPGPRWCIDLGARRVFRVGPSRRGTAGLGWQRESAWFQHWTNGGETSLENAALMCSRHHTLVHEGGFTMKRDGDELRFFDPTGREIPPTGAIVSSVTRLPAMPPPRPGWDG